MISPVSVGRYCLTLFFLLFTVLSQSAPVPIQQISYQGYLNDASGNPVNGLVNLTFKLYATESGGSATWTEVHPGVTASQGVFAVQLGQSTSFSSGLFDTAQWLGIQIGADTELSPRQPLLAVPYALKAQDADMVDGMEANELIDAASDEVRTPISSLPFTISTSGSYYVTGNLDGSSGGIDITADDVTLDLMGFTLDGGGSIADSGVTFNGRSNITIHNGTVRGFGYTGLYQAYSTARYSRVIDMRVLDNGSSSSYSGIYLDGSNNLVLRCTAGNNGYYGIFVGTSSLVKDSTAYSNQSTGISVGKGSTINNNTAYDNQSKCIYGYYGSTLINNTAYYNQSWGIYAAGANTVRSNTVYSNNQAQSANVGGIRIGSDSQAINNTVDSNCHTGIYVSGTDNILRNNHATDSILVDTVSQCFYFASIDNAAIGNTATGCTTEFAGSLPPAARFIDNIGW